MFKQARIKLTGWYLLIIMTISIFFSVVIYVGIARELERGFRRIEMRFRTGGFDIPLPRQLLPGNFENISQQLVEDLEAAKKRVVLNLLFINGVILSFSAVAGYFLAGKTLGPIELALEEHKRFVADASHEFRTPLTSLKTSMEVALRDRKISLPEAKKLIKSNLEDVNGMQSLANNLLSLANYQNNGKSLSFEKVDITELIENTKRKILPLAKEKNLDLEIKVSGGFIFANKESLEQMMLIFLDNAVKYTPKEGKVMVSAKADKKHLIIQIKDTGIGISEKDLPLVFDRFYRGDQSRSKDKVSGFGLGLSLAKRIVEIHKGSVEVASSLGKGTTFTIKLPL